ARTPRAPRPRHGPRPAPPATRRRRPAAPGGRAERRMRRSRGRASKATLSRVIRSPVSRRVRTRGGDMGTLLLALLLSCSDDGVSVYNTPPSAALTNPPDGSAHDEGTVVTFDGLVDDSQDDPEALVVTLQSGKDGTT